MGEMADMILDGEVCQYCGEPIDEDGECGCAEWLGK
jgi:hypothetical protein